MKETMNSLERVRTVLQGGIPDRVPISLLCFQNAARFAGYQVAECCKKGELLAESHLAYWEEFRHDMVDMEMGVACMAEAVGCEVEYNEDEPPWVVGTPIDSLNEINTLPEIDVEQVPVLVEFVKATKILSGEIGDQVCIRSESDQGPFSLAAQILGMEDFLIALTDAENFDKIHQLLAYCTRQIAKLAKALAAAGAHYTEIGDSIAGPDMCHPDTYREFCFPYEEKLIAQLHREGVEMGVHICGDATDVIEYLVETGAPFLEIDSKVDRQAIRQATAGKTTVVGTIDPANLLPFGTPQEIAQKVREDIQIFAPNGRYICSPGCTLPALTPFENIRALVDAVHQFGRYDPTGKLAAS